MQDHPILLPKNLNQLCEEMSDLLEQLDKKMLQTLKSQETSFSIAFRKVKDRMIRELLSVQEQYQQFVEQIQNEKTIQAFEQQLNFFRNECYALNELKKKLEADNKILQAKIAQFSDEKEESTRLLHKLQDENLTIKSVLAKLKDQRNSIIQSINLTGIEHKKDNQSNFESRQQLLTPITSYTFQNKTKANENISKNRLLSEEKELNPNGNLIKIEQESSRKNYYLQNSNPILNYLKGTEQNNLVKVIRKKDLFNQSPDDSDLKKLFKTCVGNLMQEIKLRKLKQKVQKKNDELIRNSLNENKLLENDTGFIKVTKFDQRQLMEKYFAFSLLTSRFLCSQQFMSIVNAQIFGIKCCNNANCLYNFRKFSQDQTPDAETEILTNKIEIKVPSNLTYVRKKFLNTYKPEWTDREKSYSVNSKLESLFFMINQNINTAQLN